MTWIDVNKELPKWATKVLVCEYGVIGVGVLFSGNEWMVEESFTKGVTHWQSLPKPPK